MTTHNAALSAADIELDQDGHLCDHTIWTPAIAQQLADTLEVNLSDEHLEILQQVRAFFDKFNHAPATRPLIKWLQKKLCQNLILAIKSYSNCLIQVWLHVMSIA